MTQIATVPQTDTWRESVWLFAGWFVLALVAIVLATQNLAVPGLYYDEAVFGGLAKDFVTGHVHGQHMPDTQVVTFLGRPFPIFVQTYLGALKSWMLIPVLSVFGSSLGVLRATTLAWGLIALFFFMLGTRRWLGLKTALFAGALLTFDPTYFFLCTLDWGVAIPSFVCRCACFYFAVVWLEKRTAVLAFLVGLFAGLGFFNKADFAIFLIGITMAGLCCYPIFRILRRHPIPALSCGLGFLLGGGLMLVKIPRLLILPFTGAQPSMAHEFSTKLDTLLSMYDGSHFYRLMDAGGVFEKMYVGPAGGRDALGLGLVVALICLVTASMRPRQNQDKQRAIVFLVLATVLITLGVMILPYAVRIHHAVLVFPLPQLVISAVAVVLWQRTQGVIVRTLIFVMGLALVASQLYAIATTERLLAKTGGRGRWSQSLDEFCQQNRNRSDLTIVSLDWGFNEQLIFLTDRPRLRELFWNFNQAPPMLPADPNTIYLVHPEEYSASRYDLFYLEAANKSGQNVEIQPHVDRQNKVAFHTIRFEPQ